MQISNYDAGLLSGLGFGELTDAEEKAMKECAMYHLYKSCRRAGEKDKFPAEDRTFKADWIDLSNPDLQLMAFDCAGYSEDGSLKNPRRYVKSILEAADWNGYLGISDPPIQCKVLIHGQRWGVRFQSVGKLKGREKRNCDLPPANIPECDDEPSEGGSTEIGILEEDNQTISTEEFIL